jgi:hypothetical protein
MIDTLALCRVNTEQLQNFQNMQCWVIYHCTTGLNKKKRKKEKWSRVLEKLLVTQLVQELYAFYGIQRALS